MEVIIPQALKVLECTVDEDDAQTWVSTATYAVGDKVVYAHYVYRAVTAVAAGKIPPDNCDADGEPWRCVSVTNQYAALDIYSYTQTKARGQTALTIKVPFTPPATAIALLNMQAVTVTVSVHDSTGELVWGGEPTSLLRDSQHAWDYWFGSFKFQRDSLFTGIPPTSGTVTVTLTHGTCPAIGMIVVGERIIFGETQYGARSGFIDYSKTEADEYGNEAWSPRGTARRGTFPVWIDPVDMDYVQDILSDLAGNPAFWIGGPKRSMQIHGFLKEYDASAEDYEKIMANFEVRGIK